MGIDDEPAIPVRWANKPVERTGAESAVYDDNRCDADDHGALGGWRRSCHARARLPRELC